MHEQYQELLKLLQEPVLIDGKYYSLENEIDQLEVYNKKVAGTRIRKILQMIRSLSVEMRLSVQEKRNSI